MKHPSERIPRLDAPVPLETGVFDPARNVVVRATGEAVPLSPTEGRLLAYLAARPGEFVSREILLGEVWGYARAVDTRTVYTTVNRLRTKIESDPRAPRHVLSRPVLGYCFEPGEPAAFDDLERIAADADAEVAAWRRQEPMAPLAPEVRDRRIDAAQRALAAGRLDLAVRVAEALLLRARWGGSEALALVDRLLDAGPSAAVRADLLEHRCSLYIDGGRTSAAVADAEAAVALLEPLGDVGRTASALRTLVVALRRDGRLLEALGTGERALALVDEEHPTFLSLLGDLGTVCGDLGRQEAQQSYHQRAWRLARRVGRSRSEGYAALNLGVLAGAAGRYLEAIAMLESAVDAAERSGDDHLYAGALSRLSDIERRMGRLDDAAVHLERALAVERQHGWVINQAVTLMHLGLLRLERDEVEAGRLRFLEALLLLEEGGSPRLRGIVHLNLASLALLSGTLFEAVEHAEAAQALVDAADDPGLAALIGAAAGEARVRSGEVDEGLAAIAAGIDTLRGLRSPELLLECTIRMADLLLSLGRADEGWRYLEESRTVSRMLRAPPTGRVHRALERCERAYAQGSG